MRAVGTPEARLIPYLRLPGLFVHGRKWHRWRWCWWTLSEFLARSPSHHLILHRTEAAAGDRHRWWSAPRGRRKKRRRTTWKRGRRRLSLGTSSAKDPPHTLLFLFYLPTGPSSHRRSRLRRRWKVMLRPPLPDEAHRLPGNERPRHSDCSLYASVSFVVASEVFDVLSSPSCPLACIFRSCYLTIWMTLELFHLHNGTFWNWLNLQNYTLFWLCSSRLEVVFDYESDVELACTMLLAEIDWSLKIITCLALFTKNLSCVWLRILF